MDSPRYIISHDRGYINVDEHALHFTADGNWGNLQSSFAEMEEHQTGIPEIQEVKRIAGLTTIGLVLALISIGLLLTAVIIWSILFLFLGSAVAYLSWAASRPEELTGLSISKDNIRAVSLVDQELRITLKTHAEGGDPIVIKKADRLSAHRLKEELTS